MRALRRAERWWWTGPVGHFVGGGLDFAVAWGRYRIREALAPDRSRETLAPNRSGETASNRNR